MRSQAIPLTVLGGYLGSGKTTLLNHILRHAAGRRLALIVNDFGSINVDASLIESHDGDMVNLANGCVCCGISGGLSEALATLSRRTPRPEQVIIEASGVADPTKVGHFGSLPPYRLDSVVVVADAETIRQRAEDRYVGGTVLRQLQGADIVVLNKTDLVSQPQQTALKTWLHRRVPDARILATNHGKIPLAVLLGAHGEHAPAIEHTQPGHDHHDDYESWSLTSDTGISAAAFRAAISAWPATVLRAKGVIFLQDDPSRRHVFQLVGRRWSLTPDRGWAGETPRTTLVLIGLTGRLDGDALLRASLPDHVAA